jgi:hypothetical protein
MTFFNNGKPKDPLEFMRSYIGLAISIGAPSYNLGDHRGCYEVYACTARLLYQGVTGAEEARQTLRDALEKCSLRSDVNEMAWIMRRAFDSILGEEPGNLELD